MHFPQLPTPHSSSSKFCELHATAGHCDARRRAKTSHLWPRRFCNVSSGIKLYLGCAGSSREAFHEHFG
ncbi:hypothetical protein THAOC_19097 [Thalassiosira oceanica]|uniref:Uncharacterized protein n=1 Tax=Thalassiosira oceanica TaxID=159749 RepID=K0S6J2_THAOC|nr:hypothetical protein THAOC_19097 [Thalassiosira oceanica]|eukprot:EJK60534.1 hypothetical protein THAOC_19097 [Thalassiosira oceanica]